MKHDRFDYLCVITGWDFQCEASSEWLVEMVGAEELEGGANQPFYNVFADDGSSRYAAQGTMSIINIDLFIRFCNRSEILFCCMRNILNLYE